MWVALRATVGFSDLWASTLLPYAALVYLASSGRLVTDRTLVVVGVTTTAAVLAFLLTLVFEFRRDTGRKSWVVVGWVLIAVVAGAVGTVGPLLLENRRWIGIVALAGIGIAALGFVVDLVLTAVRSFGVLRSRMPLRCGLLATKIVFAAVSVGLLTHTAGTVGARSMPTLVLIGYWLATSAAALTAAVGCGLFATFRDQAAAVASLPSQQGQRRIAGTRRRGRRRG